MGGLPDLVLMFNTSLRVPGCYRLGEIARRYCNCELFAIKCSDDRRNHRDAADYARVPDDRVAGLAPSARRGLALRGVRDDRGPPVRVDLEATAGIPWTRVPGG